MTDTTTKMREHYRASFLLTERDTSTALEQAGFKAVLWRDDTQTALDWFNAVMSAPAQNGPNLGVVIGPDFPIIIGNLARNIRENRLGVLAAVLTCNSILSPPGAVKDGATRRKQ